ncbi:hypothetical protein OROMI_011292 [Orobanche minor]
MSEVGNTWLNLPKYTKEYTDGVKLFVDNAMAKYSDGNEIKCPCRKCENRFWRSPKIVHDHLICSGPCLTFVEWIYDVTSIKDSNIIDSEQDMGFHDNLDEMFDVIKSNAGPNEDAKKFYRHVNDGKQPLYPGCKKFSRLSFLVRLYHWKCINGVTESAFGEILQLMKEAIPDINVPESFNSVKRMIHMSWQIKCIKRVSTEVEDNQDRQEVVEDDLNGQFSNDTIFRSIIEEADREVSCFREDIPVTEIPIPSPKRRMEVENLVIRLHHSGQFLTNKYSGGDYDLFNEDPDTFYYSVLMEFVKQMKMDEIGGVYVPKGKKGGWKLVYDDRSLSEYIQGKSEVDFYIDSIVDKTIPVLKQMQPWVIVRPRPSPLAKENKAEKRTFVTLKNINAEKERRMNTRKKLTFQEADDSLAPKDGLLGLEDFMKTYEIRGGITEIEAGMDLVKNVEGQGCNDYEMRRNKNVAENKAKMKELGLDTNRSAMSCQKDKGKGKVSRDSESESEYVPDNNDEPERQSDEDDDNVTSKRTKRIKIPRVQTSIIARPRTRSRANILPDSSEKEVAAGATSVPVEISHVNDAPRAPLSLKEKLKHLRDGPGSMTAYLELREREKQQLAKEISQPDTQTPHLQSNSVDTSRGEKNNYYYPFPTDEERLKNKPEEVSLSDWKVLLKYWADEKVQDKARKNAAARQRIIESHTTGPRSFAQVAHKLRLQKLEEMHNTGDGDCEVEPVLISDADIYLETRKRRETGKYKVLPKEVAENFTQKIDDVKKVLKTDGVEAADKLVHGDKKHRPSYLIGRLVQEKKPKSKSLAPSASSSVQADDQYVSDLTAKIRAQLQQEMDEKLDKKVREMMKMLADKNPDLRLNIEDSEKATEESRGDDNVTP